MIDKLGEMISDFPGRANQTHCFAHVVNLVAKTIIKQFDIPKKKKNKSNDKRNDEEQMLEQLAEGIDIEEIKTRIMSISEEQDNDNDEGWIDEAELLSEEE
jgi:hypothetical protein